MDGKRCSIFRAEPPARDTDARFDFSVAGQSGRAVSACTSASDVLANGGPRVCGRKHHDRVVMIAYNGRNDSAPRVTVDDATSERS